MVSLQTSALTDGGALSRNQMGIDAICGSFRGSIQRGNPTWSPNHERISHFIVLTDDVLLTQKPVKSL